MGLRLLEVLAYRERGQRRETRLLDMLKFVHRCMLRCVHPACARFGHWLCVWTGFWWTQAM